MSQSRPRSPQVQPQQAPLRGNLSKVTGAGSGTGLVVLAEALPINPVTRLALQLLAPWLAIGVALVGPYFSTFVVLQVKYFGLMHLLKRAKYLEASIPASAPNKAVAQAKVAEMETLIGDVITAMAHTWSGITVSGPGLPQGALRSGPSEVGGPNQGGGITPHS